MNNLTPFPWHYFVRSVRARITLVIVSSILTFTITQVYTDYLFPKVIFLILGLILFSIIQGYLRILPVRKILAKIDQIQVQLPHNKKLNIIYQKNEWILIQEMLKLTEKYIQEQSKQIVEQNTQSQIVLESIADPILIVDQFMNCKQYNTAFKTLFIQGKETKVFRDEKLWKIFDDQKILKLFEKAKRKNKVTRLSAHQIGSQYYNISITPITNKENKIEEKNIGLLCLFHDVTDTKLSEKMRVDFVANVSHEIRTPLTSIKGFSQLIQAQEKDLPPMISTPLERIVFNIGRLEELFNTLLKLSVIESNHSIEKNPLNLTALLSSIKANLTQKYKKNFKVNIENGLTVLGDPKLLEHAFTNIIDNSIKYNNKELAIVNISLESDQKYDHIKISDNGPGIPESDLKRIFERFYRVQGQEYKNIEGTGLGLSIVKHVINKHNGVIHVESKLQEGTEFHISLPKQQV